MPARSPVPDVVAAELERVVRRWQQLPLDHALSAAPALRSLAQELADATCPGARARIEDLGPRTAYDQLAVLTYDACAAGLADELRLAERLAELRRSLA
jgi:hypothetical protein